MVGRIPRAEFFRRRRVSDVVVVAPVPVQLGLAAYWDTTDGLTLNGSNVSGVAEMIGGLDLAQVSAGAQPAAGSGYVTNASGDWLTRASEPVFNPGTGAFAAFADVRTSTSGTQVAFGTRITGAHGTVKGWFVRTVSGRLLEVLVDWAGGAGTGSVYHRYGALSSGAWAHVGFVWDPASSTVTTYVDGVAQTPTTTFSAGTIGGGSVNPATALGLGAMPVPTQHWVGDLKGPGIWNRLPTAEEIAILCAWEAARRV